MLGCGAWQSALRLLDIASETAQLLSKLDASSEARLLQLGAEYSDLLGVSAAGMWPHCDHPPSYAAATTRPRTHVLAVALVRVSSDSLECTCVSLAATMWRALVCLFVSLDVPLQSIHRLVREAVPDLDAAK